MYILWWSYLGMIWYTGNYWASSRGLKSNAHFHGIFYMLDEYFWNVPLVFSEWRFNTPNYSNTFTSQFWNNKRDPIFHCIVFCIWTPVTSLGWSAYVILNLTNIQELFYNCYNSSIVDVPIPDKNPSVIYRAPKFLTKLDLNFVLLGLNLNQAGTNSAVTHVLALSDEVRRNDWLK